MARQCSCGAAGAYRSVNEMVRARVSRFQSIFSGERRAPRAREKYEVFETAQELKRGIMALLDASSNGWVSKEAWEMSVAANREAFGEWMRSVAESKEMNEQEARALWPFDEMGTK